MPETSPKKILIIDDDGTVRNMLKEHLESNGFETVEATSGAQSADLLEENLPDMVITDLLLPGEHGIDIVKEIKNRHQIPVVVMSGIYKKGELANFLESEYVDAFFPKPLDLNKILEFIRSTLNG